MEGGKPEYCTWRKTLRARREPITNSTHIWHQAGIEPGPHFLHIGGKRSQNHTVPCFPQRGIGKTLLKRSCATCIAPAYQISTRLISTQRKHEKLCFKITFRIIVKITPCWSWRLLFTSKRDLSCLFSSQVPLPFFEDITKFAEVHQAFCKHDWLHEIKLEDLKRFTTWSGSRLFSCVRKYAERKDWEFPSTTKTTIFIISWNRMKARTCLTSML